MNPDQPLVVSGVARFVLFVFREMRQGSGIHIAVARKPAPPGRLHYEICREEHENFGIDRLRCEDSKRRACSA